MSQGNSISSSEDLYFVLKQLSKKWTDRSQLIFRWKLNGTNKYQVINGLTQKLNKGIYKLFHFRIVQFVFEHDQTNTSLVVPSSPQTKWSGGMLIWEEVLILNFGRR